MAIIFQLGTAKSVSSAFGAASLTHAQHWYRVPSPGELVPAALVSNAVYGIMQGDDFVPWPGSLETVSIGIDDYNKLIAADPATGKPAGRFRNDDVWELHQRLVLAND